ncbi:MAG: DNA-methyltransferase [Candidatus Hodarchaeales archaeon]
MPSKKIDISGQTVYFQSAKNMQQIPSESVTLIVTSPPYWNVRDYGEHKDQIGFDQTYEEYIDSLNQVWNECIRVLQPNGKIAINVQPLPIESTKSGFGRRIIRNIMWDIEKFMRDHNLFLSGMHYWSKIPYISNVSWGSYPKPTNIASNTAFEQIFVWVKPGKTRKIPKEILDQNLLTKDEWRHWAVRCIWDDISPVIKINSRGENRFGHSAPFPEDIPYRIIKMHTVTGETVLDPFLGSGTTLKICRIAGRKGIGFEINDEYKDLITSRIMEDWFPPDIQSQYKTFGTSDFYQILQLIQNTLQQDPSIEFDALLKKLRKLLPNKFTKSWVEHILKLYKQFNGDFHR